MFQNISLSNGVMSILPFLKKNYILVKIRFLCGDSPARPAKGRRINCYLIEIE